MVKFVMVSLDKEMYDEIAKRVKSEKTYFVSDFVKKLVTEFFKSPHELDIEERRIRSAHVKLQIRLTRDVYEMLKEYANRHRTGLAHVVRAIIAERIGIQRQDNKEEKNARKKRSDGGMVTVTFKLEKDVLKKLDLLAINTKRARSTLIREAVMHLINGGYNTVNQTVHLAATREL